MTGPLPLVFQDFEMIRMPYVNSSRIHIEQSLTDRSNQDQINEINKQVDRVLTFGESEAKNIVQRASSKKLSAFIENMIDPGLEDEANSEESSDSSAGMEQDDRGSDSSEDVEL
jgi:hypothetical protein